jgi:cytochrome d ubiquinol oxidase subunit II
LFTNWRVRPTPGILDWYTVLAGLMAFATLTIHGALYLVTKTEGEVNARSRRIILTMWPLLLLLTTSSLIATMQVRPEVLNNYWAHPVGLAVPIAVCGALGVMLHGTVAGRERLAFMASCVYIAAMLAGAAFALYPKVLPASTLDAYSLTIHNTAAAQYGLKVGLSWWIIGMVMALGYFVFVYRMFRGKIRVEAEEGY